MGSQLFDVRGLNVLVTGGSRGIGFSIAQSFVEAGASVFISARNAPDCEAAAQRLAQLGRCVSLPGDLASLDGVDELAAALQNKCAALNVLVNNAGATWGAPVDNFPEDQWDKVVDVNMKAPFFLVQRLLPLLREAASQANPARVLNIGSIAGLNPMGRDSFAYAASKAGLHHLTRHLARHLAPLITVNAIAPGAFETRMISFAIEKAEARAALEAQIPRAQVGQADDIAGAALFFASRAGAYVTGTVLPVDGGLSLRNP